MRTFVKSCIVCFMAILAVSCSSLQGGSIESISLSMEHFELEKRFAQIDSDFISGNGNSADAEVLVFDLERMASAPGVKKATAARFYALSGCILLHLGKKSEASSRRELSFQSFKGDVYTVILAHRIDKNNRLSAEHISQTDAFCIILEEAIQLYLEKNYREAVAKFDSAFISADSYYRASYDRIRNECWNLREVTIGEASGLLSLKKISVMQMLLLTDENSELLYAYSAGKKLNDKELFIKIMGGGLLNPVSQSLSAENALSADDVVNKFIASRFLWNLFNVRKNTTSRASRYSEAYKKQGRVSPVKDVEVENADFDAVLGCVEKEIMNLDDGVNFNGNRELSAVEFNESLKKLK